MPKSALDDLASLAWLAQSEAAPDLRPLVLRAQVQAFAGTAGRQDPRTLARFEALVLGLVPLVSDDTLADAAAALRQVPDTPPRVLEAIDRRIGGDASGRRKNGPVPVPEPARAPTPDSVEKLIAENDGRVDLALAKHGGIVLDGRALGTLVERARDRGDLARALLDRPDLSALDRAVLYRWADSDARAGMRQVLPDVLLPYPFHLLPLPFRLRESVSQMPAGDGSLRRWLDEAAAAVGLALDLPEVFETEADGELLALALVATGLEPDSCMGALIRGIARTARPGTNVVRLAAIAADTPRPVAACLAGGGRPVHGGERPRPNRDAAVPSASGALSPGGRAGQPGGRATPPNRLNPHPQPASGAIVRLDRR